MAKQKSVAIRQSILEAATKVFARTGFYKAKALEIANKANIAVGTIYNYFKNKDDILISIFNERIGELNRTLISALEGVDDPDQKLAIILSSSISAMKNDREFAEVVTIELRQSSKFFSSTAISSVLEFLEIITNVICDGQKRGIYRSDVDARVVSLTLLGSLENLLQFWVLCDRLPEIKYKYNISLEEGKEAVERLLRRGLH
jgi:TetR/AcrR family fatty acid metabolism transcriptional regulator